MACNIFSEFPRCKYFYKCPVLREGATFGQNACSNYWSWGKMSGKNVRLNLLFKDRANFQHLCAMHFVQCISRSNCSYAFVSSFCKIDRETKKSSILKLAKPLGKYNGHLHLSVGPIGYWPMMIGLKRHHDDDKPQLSWWPNHCIGL